MRQSRSKSETIISYTILSILILILAAILISQSDYDLSVYGFQLKKQTLEARPSRKINTETLVPPGYRFLSAVKTYDSVSLYEKIDGKDNSLTIGNYWFSYKYLMYYSEGFAIAIVLVFITWVIRKYLELKTLRTLIPGIIVFILIFLGFFLGIGAYDSTPMFEVMTKKAGYFYTKISPVLFFASALFAFIPAFITIKIKTRRRKNKK